MLCLELWRLSSKLQYYELESAVYLPPAPHDDACLYIPQEAASTWEEFIRSISQYRYERILRLIRVDLLDTRYCSINLLCAYKFICAVGIDAQQSGGTLPAWLAYVTGGLLALIVIYYCCRKASFDENLAQPLLGG